MASSTQSTDSKKKLKHRRSLRKHPHVTLDPNRCLGIDMDQRELNDIFSKLNTGELENPQQALAKVYSLALDALENTLQDGIHQICQNLQDASNHPADNFFAPWLKKILPAEPQKIQALKDSFLDRVNDGKIKLQKSLSNAYQADAQGENTIDKVQAQTANALRKIIDETPDKTIAFKHPLSPQRIDEIMRILDVPTAHKPRQLQISQNDGIYHFSFGTHFHPLPDTLILRDSPQNFPKNSPKIETQNVASSAENQMGTSQVKADDSSQISHSIESSSTTPEKRAISNTEVPIVTEPVHDPQCDENTHLDVNEQNSDISQNHGLLDEKTSHPSESHAQNIEFINHSFKAFSNQIHETLSSVPPEFVDNLKSSAEDVVAMATEVTAVMQEIALQIANATLDAYHERRFIPSLSESLQDDPRIDSELSSFIQSLESLQDDNASVDVPNNDELANAFDLLLGEID